MRGAIAWRTPAGRTVHGRSNVGRTAGLAHAGAIGPVTGARTIGTPRTIAYPRFSGAAGTISRARLSGTIRTPAGTGLFRPSRTIACARARRLRPLALWRQLGRFRFLRLRRTRGGPRRFAGPDPRSRPLRPRLVYLARARRTANAPAGPPGGLRCYASARRTAKASPSTAAHASAETTPGFSLANATSVEDTRRLRRQGQRHHRDKNNPEELLHSGRLTSPNRFSLRLVTPNHRMAPPASSLLGRLPQFSPPWQSCFSILGN